MTDRDAHDRLRDRVRRLVDFLPGYGWAASADGHIVYISVSLYELVANGHTVTTPPSADEFAWKPEVRPENYEAIAARWAHSVRTGENYDIDHEMLCADGNYRWVKSTAKAVRSRSGEIQYWLGIVVDIDRAVRAAENAQLSESRLRVLLDTIPAPVWSADADGKLVYSNQEHMGQTSDNIEKRQTPDIGPVNFSMWSVIHPDDQDGVEASVRESFETGAAINLKYRMLSSDGSYRWVNNKAQALMDANGEIFRWYGVSFDIDDEVRLRHDLAEREIELRRVVDTLPALIWTAGDEGQPIYFNQRLKDWSGTTVEQIDAIAGGHLASSMFLIHPDDQRDTKTRIEDALETGKAWVHRFRLRRGDGSYRWLEARLAPLRNKADEILHWYGLAVDIHDEVAAKNELRLSQDRLARANHIMVMAEFSAAIIHEITQPLASIVASADATRRWLEIAPPNEGKAMASLERLVLSANNASDVITRIRKLFEASPPTRKLQRIDPIILRAIEIAKEESLIKRTQIVTELSSSAPELPVDPIEIQQVVVNLIRNAAEAMAEGAIGPKIIWVRSELNEGKILISVEDSGPGIQTGDAIFEPFVTTKPKGLGIGLAISRSIVLSCGGQLWAENTGNGAKFTIELPLPIPA